MKAKKIILWITGILTAVITGIMDFVLIPKIEASTNGIHIFDMNSFGYSVETARKFLQTISDESRNLYLNAQLPLDFVYPVIYTVFFILLIITLKKKVNGLIALPLVLFVADYTENICSVIMLKSAEFPEGIAKFASTVTLSKSLLMYACFIIIIVLIVKNIIRKKKENKNV